MNDGRRNRPPERKVGPAGGCAIAVVVGLILWVLLILLVARPLLR